MELEPMLAVPGRRGEIREGFAYEFKWDGVRALAFVEDGRVSAYTRRGNEVAATYPELADLAVAGDAVIDGEIVALADGRPSFPRLQRRMNVSDPHRVAQLARQLPVAFLAFDVLRIGDESMLEVGYEDRRAALRGLDIAGPRVQVPPRHDDLDHTIGVAADLGLEGIVAKRLGSTYQPGQRSRDWRKLALVRRRDFVVGGYRPRRGGGRPAAAPDDGGPGEASRPGPIGSLLVGYHDGGGALRYAGAVGSGLSRRLDDRLRRRLRPTGASPFADPVPHGDAVFVSPELVVAVQFRQWTPDGVLRQPSIKGLRPDRDPADVGDVDPTETAGGGA